jgi:hypothetical protein
VKRRDLKRVRRLVRLEAEALQAIFDAVPTSVVRLPGVMRPKILRVEK